MRVLLVLSVILYTAAANTLRFVPLSSESQEPEVLCPDKQTSCPPDRSCCKLATGLYGCCPLSQEEKPSQPIRDEEGHKNGGILSKLLRKTPAGRVFSEGATQREGTNTVLEQWSEQSVLCPDGQSLCPDGYTCCRLEDGEWGCCPYRHANCCPDHKHCCPHNYRCDTRIEVCIDRHGNHYSWTPKAASLKIRTIICPGGKAHCPDYTTCCLLQTGHYGCCPLPNATCCKDKLHCCPHDSYCDFKADVCNKNGSLTPFLRKFPALTVPRMPTPKKGIVQCPGGASFCPDKTTCCQLASGQYGCCPHPKAVCCADKEHCCPQDYQCDSATGECIHQDNGAVRIPWAQKLHAKPRMENKDDLLSVLCPDGKGICPEGSTCCLLSSGQYGCCPLPKAVCCKDHLHCCPEGTTCNSAAGKCDRGESSVSMTWFTKTAAMPVREEKTSSAVLCPDGKGTCPEGSTCCLLASGQYGCCPLPKAVCCKDHLHCCPNGTTCNSAAGKCDRGESSVSMTWFTKSAATPVREEKTSSAVLCPDGKGTCPEGSTCCLLASGQYGCCPLPKAVCCKDHLHCCPNGTTCNSAAGKCDRGESSVSMTWFTKTAATPVREEKTSSAVLCPDGKGTCPEGSTCCLLSSGQYGCCPLPKAVCCKDHLHCCPEGTTCNSAAGKCDRGESSVSMTWFTKTAATPVTEEKTSSAVLCPDGKGTCPEGSTCCLLASGQYGCCPLPKAVCCKDHLHCCPNGTTCNSAAGKCDRGESSVSMTWFTKSAATPVREEKTSSAVLCPDGKGTCPEGSTCCLLASGQYGCCPLPKAVCCKDHLHCCPNGTTCNSAAGKCDRGESSVSMTWFTKTAATPVREEKTISAVLCPDGKGTCPEGSTCCLLSSGQYGCCPLPKAVCCKDHLHCCPEGTTCNSAAGKCDRGESSVSMTWFTKTAATPVTEEKTSSAVLCPDGKGTCPEGSTCCLLTSGQYGCCPLPKAVCCKDHLHCCPEGTTCNSAAGKCDRGESSVSMTWFTKTAATPVREEKTSSAVLCPDGKGTCPEGSTCCLLASGQYGCCPLPKAVCCKDHLHCCPNGTTCNSAAGKCDRGESSVSMTWFTKTAATPVREEKTSSAVLCPDGKGTCPEGSTCCLLSSGQYGCCPLPKAVCCKDHLHCCPEGTTCNSAAGKCDRGESSVSMTWFTKTAATPVREEKTSSVLCPDGKGTCPEGSTCCLLSSGQYGCCPLPKAVCCKDHLHCCPEGTTCNSAAGKCDRGESSVSMTWFTKTAATPVREEKTSSAVLCPDGKGTCPEGSTCCLLASGQYGCCPLPKAVCCKDHLHCCPNGTTCNSAAGKCDRGESSVSMTWFTKTAATPVREEKTSSAVLCPDGKGTCPEGSTCCLLASGQYGCCPLPKAVCCKDHLHCCPEGTTCNSAAGKCDRGESSVSMTWFTKTAATPVREEKTSSAVLCPDGKGTCPEGSTCCLLASGQYACCPLPKAVCCKDHLHCCPNGTTCNSAAGKCDRGESSVSMTWFTKTAATPVREEKTSSVLCPDGKGTCPEGSTCCLLSSGQYGCCPLPKAVCCKDHLHCCPEGTTCNSAAGKCDRGESSVSMTWLPKNAAAPLLGINPMEVAPPVGGTSSAVICPDGRSQCPDQTTCCTLQSGQYGCCPLPNAVCCSDKLHCCPSGTKCNIAAGRCTKGESSVGITWLPKMPAMMAGAVVPESQPPSSTVVTCPDKRYKCPNGSTCCKTARGQWACCALPKAICCSDHKHCCPSDYVCSPSGTKCQRGSEVISSVPTILAIGPGQ